jgi:hypothetical protein
MTPKNASTPEVGQSRSKKRETGVENINPEEWLSQ